MRKILDWIRQNLLRRGPENARLAAGGSFRTLFANFQELIDLNNRILHHVAEANDKLSGDYIFDYNYIETTCTSISSMVRDLVYLINRMTHQKFPGLYEAFERIEGDIQAMLEGKIIAPRPDFILPYPLIDRDLMDAVGGKNAHIAETGNVLGLKIPLGFAITITAYQYFLDHNRLQPQITAITDSWHKGEIPVDEASRAIRKLILAAVVPPKLEQRMLYAARHIGDIAGVDSPRFAVRSSAYGEDSSSSFAGQYLSRLNVTIDELSASYREVVASAFTAQAMEYRKQKDFRENEILMSVACQLMIPARASGVIYSIDPVHPEKETLIINSSWGLGEPVVSGRTATDTFILDRRPPHRERELNVVRKELNLVACSEQGTNLEPVPRYYRTRPSLSADQRRRLAEIAMQLEKYFKTPQDIEFAVDHEGEIVILQARPLRLKRQNAPRASELADLPQKYPVIFRDRGVAAMEGVATGPVHLIRSDSDLDNFPDGAIAVAKHASPMLARVIPRAVGFITDVGATTGHLATVAREFRIPALFNADEATSLLREDETITLDTEERVVYRGAVRELELFTLYEEHIEETYEYRLLRRILKKIEPLNLLDPNAENFKPQYCRTYHDITRFIHEKAVATLIDRNYYHCHDPDTVAGRLKWDLPLDLILIDIGGGISGTSGNTVLPEQIASDPMQALLTGMSFPGAWDMDPAPVDMGSFMSSLTRTFSAELSNPQEVGQNLAVVSAEYVNLSLRLGYHFTIIDAYVTENIKNNHAYFRFSGGVTDTVRRKRRTRLLDRILTHYDFVTQRQGDMLVARLKRLDKKGMIRRLYLLGLLVGFTRQLDVRMVDDQKIDFYYRKILSIMEENDGQQQDQYTDFRR
ncbi:PEP/pyruvate-binding domain-containing protein [Desulfolithobacter sp.]